MAWNVDIHNKVEKKLKKLPQLVVNALTLLVTEIEQEGPVRGNWPNYSKLSRFVHHCHLRKGRNCYVAIWREVDGKINLIEVNYVGTHEKAPY